MVYLCWLLLLGLGYLCINAQPQAVRFVKPGDNITASFPRSQSSVPYLIELFPSNDPLIINTYYISSNYLLRVTVRLSTGRVTYSGQDILLQPSQHQTVDVAVYQLSNETSDEYFLSVSMRPSIVRVLEKGDSNSFTTNGGIVVHDYTVNVVDSLYLNFTTSCSEGNTWIYAKYGAPSTLATYDVKKMIRKSDVLNLSGRKGRWYVSVRNIGCTSSENTLTVLLNEPGTKKIILDTTYSFTMYESIPLFLELTVMDPAIVSLTVTLTSDASPGQLRAYVRRDFPPSPALRLFDDFAIAVPYSFAFYNSTAGSFQGKWYILVEGLQSADGKEFQILATGVKIEHLESDTEVSGELREDQMILFSFQVPELPIDKRDKMYSVKISASFEFGKCSATIRYDEPPSTTDIDPTLRNSTFFTRINDPKTGKWFLLLGGCFLDVFYDLGTYHLSYSLELASVYTLASPLIQNSISSGILKLTLPPKQPLYIIADISGVVDSLEYLHLLFNITMSNAEGPTTLEIRPQSFFNAPIEKIALYRSYQRGWRVSPVKSSPTPLPSPAGEGSGGWRGTTGGWRGTTGRWGGTTGRWSSTGRSRPDLDDYYLRRRSALSDVYNADLWCISLVNEFQTSPKQVELQVISKKITALEDGKPFSVNSAVKLADYTSVLDFQVVVPEKAKAVKISFPSGSSVRWTFKKDVLPPAISTQQGERLFSNPPPGRYYLTVLTDSRFTIQVDMFFSVVPKQSHGKWVVLSLLLSGGGVLFFLGLIFGLVYFRKLRRGDYSLMPTASPSSSFESETSSTTELLEREDNAELL